MTGALWGAGGLLLGGLVVRWMMNSHLADLRGDVARAQESVTFERATSERLMEAVLTMRQQGFAIAKPAKITEAPDIEAEGLRRAEAKLIPRRTDRVFVDNAVEDIKRQRPGISEREAQAEARRLLDEVRMEDPPA